MSLPPTTTRQYVNGWEHHTAQAKYWRDVATSFRNTSVGDPEDRDTAATMADAMAFRSEYLAREAILAAGEAAS